tara:strand:- start:156 stop:1913 length:1758 start_codon:yes stop_codon:yes gene_type:complete
MTKNQPSKEILNKILLQFNNNNLDKAEKMSLLLLKEDPNNIFSLKLLAIIYGKKGEYNKALEYNKKAISIDPKDPDGYNNLGISYKNLNLIQDAITAFKQAINLNPSYSDAYYNLSNAFDLQGEERQSFEANFKAVSYGSKNKYAYIKLSDKLLAQGRYDDALAQIEHILSLHSEDIEVRLHYGTCLGKVGLYNQALKCFDEILEESPDNYDAYNNKGTLLLNKGQYQDALEAFEKAVFLNSNSASASFNLSQIKQYSLNDPHLSLMNSLYKSNCMTDNDRCLLCFALGKAYEDIGDTKKAFLFLDEGNKIRSNQVKYNEDDNAEYYRKLTSNLYNLNKHSLKPKDIEINIVPIFIVGMPRSGTTLVEQILSSHDDIVGCDELTYISLFGRELSSGLTKPTKQNLINFRHKYFEKINYISHGSKMIVDKMPANFQHLGVIVSAFPEAKIIHVRRCPEATCWGIYKKLFAKGSVELNYSYNLKHIKNYYLRYLDLMKSHSNYFTDKIYELKYENLVDNQEIETKNLVKYLDIKWDDKCLNPEKNPRLVQTASNSQVREKVYRGSSLKWKKYKLFLGNIFDDLSENN